MKYQNKNWFTLIELLVIIFILWLIATAGSNFNTNTLSDKQKSESFFSKVKTNIETVKNNALIWRWIPDWADIFVPKKWEIKFSTIWSWSITTNYEPDGGGSFVNYSDYSITPMDKYEIKEIVCVDFQWNTGALSWTDWTLSIEWNTLGLEWCSSSYKILRITTTYKHYEKTFDLNTISWVIEDK